MDIEYVDVIDIATEIVNRTIDPVLGCRSIIAKLRLSDLSIVNSQAFSQAFVTLQGFESETDEFPTGDERRRYDAQILRDLDQRRVAYVNKCESEIRAACNELIIILTKITSQHRK